MKKENMNKNTYIIHIYTELTTKIVELNLKQKNKTKTNKQAIRTRAKSFCIL